MLRVPNLSATKKLPGMVWCHREMRIRFTKSVIAPYVVQDTCGYIKYMELHPTDQENLRSHASPPAEFHLQYAPILYVQVDGLKHEFLPPTPCESHRNAGYNNECQQCQQHPGLVRIKADTVTWRYTDQDENYATPVARTQLPIMPEKACPLYGLQGTTADPGLCAHWNLPRRMDKDDKWLVVYVILSRVRSLSTLASFGLNTKIKTIIESGPPENIVGSFDRLFGAKAEATRTAAAEAREALGWPVP